MLKRSSSPPSARTPAPPRRTYRDGRRLRPALETRGVPLDRFAFPERATLEMADRSPGRVIIPACGAKGSLNVPAAFGIVIPALGRESGTGYPVADAGI